MTATQELVESIRERTGDGLRLVAIYDEDDYEAIHVRDGLASRLEELGSQVHRDLVLQGIGRQHVEEMFEGGKLRSTIQHFDDLTVFYLSTGDYSGVFVSVDADVDLSVTTFTDLCMEHV